VGGHPDMGLTFDRGLGFMNLALLMVI